MRFVPLFVQSGFSYLQSTLEAAGIPAQARKRGAEAVALTDVNLAGYAPFAHAAMREGIKPIFGYFLVLKDGRKLLFYIKDEDGYRELLRLSYLASKADVSLDDVDLTHPGLVSIYLPEEGEDDIPGTTYVGLPFGLEKKKREALRASCHGRLIALPHIRYFEEDGASGIKTLEAIERKVPAAEIGEARDAHWPYEEEISGYYRAEEIELTSRVASACGDFVFLKKRGELLHFSTETGESDFELLKRKSEEGLLAKKGEINPIYRSRLDYELKTITEMGYSSYFLIVEDYVREARRRGISVGPGRGSAAGSLVAYALDIVKPDPIEHGLLFERFLNPERKSLPDIDIDFSDLRRDEVVEYLFSRYPGNRVARVLTSQTIGAKEAVRDAGRALLYPERDVSMLASTLNPFLSLRDNYRKSPSFHDLVKGDEYYLNLVKEAVKIEGLPRQRGIHAAGIVIDEHPIPEVAPAREEASNGLVINLEKDYLEEQGFLKFDLLGLRNLSILDTMLELVKEGGGPALTYEELDIHDAKAVELIRKGKTMGLFQLESEGMRKAILEVEPTSFSEVAAILALYRPGPMESIKTFARRKKGLEKVVYPARELADILDETHGIIVYQEQIMLLAEAYSGYSFGEADVLRRAISKKNEAMLKAGRDEFISRAAKKGHPTEEASRVYDLIERFASYGFNKSHAVSYAYLTMYMAYVKAHHPEAFYAGYLSYLSANDPKFTATLAEMRDMSLKLASPSIDGPYFRFEPHEGKIKIPLSYIHRLSSSVIRGIADERAKAPFAGFFDFARRLLPYGLKQEHLVALIDAGAFDGLLETRSTLRASSYEAIQYATLFGGEKGMDYLLELNIPTPSLVKREKDSRADFDAEEEVLGLIVSSSPFAPYEEEIAARGALPLVMAAGRGETLVYAAVDSVKAIVTKKGKKMAFVLFHDETSHLEGVMWEEDYRSSYPYLKKGTAVTARVRKDNYRPGSYLIDRVEPLEKEGVKQ